MIMKVMNNNLQALFFFFSNLREIMPGFCVAFADFILA
jgi:hypothetical protein